MSCSPIPIGHANVIVYDKKLNTVERFDPNGPSTENDPEFKDYKYPELDAKLAELLTCLL